MQVLLNLGIILRLFGQEPQSVETVKCFVDEEARPEKDLSTFSNGCNLALLFVA
jgi:hypothetical protein